jgi:hypothetical protein
MVYEFDKIDEFPLFFGFLEMTFGCYVPRNQKHLSKRGFVLYPLDALWFLLE